MGELGFCFTGLSNMHRCCAFPFVLAGLFFCISFSFVVHFSNTLQAASLI